ncbi:MAG TPA: prolipoprotein diacylglyceryl transferase, partial [bacterium]|nr:prolipoprotein diacylglyceryl transferase [bacterium]
GHFFGRIGCFMYGCCHGNVCDNNHFFCAVFPKGSPAYLKQVNNGIISGYSECALPVIATKVIESVFLLMLTVFLLFYDKKIKRFKGELFALYLLIYSIFRFTIEFFRGDYEKEFIFFNSLTFSQLISLGLFIIALAILINRGKTRQ